MSQVPMDQINPRGSAARPSKGRPHHAAKAVYFATGSAELAIEDIERLGLTANGTVLTVVSPAAGVDLLRTNPALRKSAIIAYTHARAIWVWLRLIVFLGFTRNIELICLNTPQNYRLLKLLAFSLRGRGSFSTGQGQTPEVSVLGMMRLSWHNYWIRHRRRVEAMPMLVIGSGSSRSLRLIATRLRQRFPGQRLTGWLPASVAEEAADVFDDVVVFPVGPAHSLCAAARLLRQCRQFKATVIPCTNEINRWLKLATLLIPLRQKEIYNEVGDAFKLADLRSGLAHLEWRFLRTDRRLAWPIAVMGSASGYYLDKIMASVRKSFPGSEIHGWLGPLQRSSVGHLFDVVHTLPGTGPSLETALNILTSGRRYRGWIVPCTDEPSRWLKWLAFSLPLRRRMLYNETGDGFPLRSLTTVWEHVCWRLRHKFTFQFLSGSSDSGLLHRLVHVPAYALRLVSASPLLFRATRRRKPSPDTGSKRVRIFVAGNGKTEKVLSSALSGHPNRLLTSVERIDAEADFVDVLFRSAEAEETDFICIFDSDCHVSGTGWLEQLLRPFDETVAQVGPELTFEGVRELYQGAFFDSRGETLWNTNSAARFHSNEAWLEVAALPIFCVVIRREALISVAADYCRGRERSCRHAGEAMRELGHLFAINGWKSICNTSVSACYPLKKESRQLNFSTVK